MADMDDDVWNKCPTTTNAVERRNRDCSLSNPQHPKLAMMEAYKLDKVACYKYIAADEGASVSYRSQTTEARAANAAARRLERKRKAAQDLSAQLGPPDKKCHLSELKITVTSTESSKQQSEVASIQVDECVVQIHTNQHPEVLGKRVCVKYDINKSGCPASQWYEGIITSYNCMTGKYSVYFSCDGVTDEFTLNEDGFNIID